MKVGTVWDRGRLFPIAQLEIERAGDGPALVVAVIDTGFTEWLALPPEAIEILGLQLIGVRRIRFGNLARELVSVYEARVKWCEEWRTISVHRVPGDPTIGMEMLRGHRIDFDALGDAEIDVEAVGPMKS